MCGVTAAEKEWLLQELLACSGADLQMRRQEELNAEQMDILSGWLQRRAGGEPLQYITGSAYFRNLHLKVDKRVLIPRPETEYLVDLLFAAADKAEALQQRQIRMIDIGCGSGAIALSVKQERPQWLVAAGDLDAGAVSMTEMNACANALEIDLRQGDLLDPWSGGEMFEVIVSNPPYVSEVGDLNAEVARWEPRHALIPDAGRDATNSVRTKGAWTAHRLLQQCVGKISRGGISLFELSPGAVHELAELWHNHERCERVSVISDLAGRERYLQIGWK